jgi:hypothetical protein
MKKITLFITCLLASASACAQTRYVGGDISMLPQYEKHNSAYKDVQGKNITNLLTWFVEDCG